MRVLVQKFGGTSLHTREMRKHAIEHVREATQEGYAVVVVVSAMGRKGDPYATDTLISQARDVAGEVPPRELDLLLSCGETISAAIFAAELNASGIRANALTGWQAGIETDDSFGDAQILRIRPQRILDLLSQGRVVVVTGFQGITDSGEVTTLGRGGSDTTAAALGVALGAEMVDIFTDVDGVMTADPRLVDEARRLDVVTYNEIFNLAYQGAKVVHPRAVEVVMAHNIPMRVRQTSSSTAGTLITSVTEMDRGRIGPARLVTGIAHTAHLVQVKVLLPHASLEDEEPEQRTQEALELETAVFQRMASAGVSVDFINVNTLGTSFTIAEEDLSRAKAALEGIQAVLHIRSGCAKVSVVGAGITGVPGVMAKIVTALTRTRIPILQSADSHTTIWCLVPQERLQEAVVTLHDAFELGKSVALTAAREAVS